MIGMLTAIIIVLLIAAVICWYVILYQPPPKYRRSRFANLSPRRWPNVYTPSPRQQTSLASALTGEYHTKQIMNNSEYNIFRIATRVVQGTRYYVWPQVSLGEVLSSPDELAFRAINCKRCDIIIADEHGRAILAIEYNGSGHDLSGDATVRDQTKQAALVNAGIRYVAIDQDETSGRIEWILRAELAKVEPQKFYGTR